MEYRAGALIGLDSSNYVDNIAGLVLSLVYWVFACLELDFCPALCVGHCLGTAGPVLMRRNL